MQKTDKLLVLGWSRSLDPLAILNVEQLRALSRLPGIDLNYRDLATDLDSIAGSLDLRTDDHAFIDALPSGDADITCAYCIAAPVGTIPTPRAGRTITFIAPEHRLQRPARRHLPQHAGVLTRDENRVVVASSWSRDRLVESGFAADKISIIPHGVDCEIFSPLSPAERAKVRSFLNFADDEFVLLNVVDSIHASGLDLLIRAFVRLRNSGYKLRLVLAPLEPNRTLEYRDVVHAVTSAAPELMQLELLHGITMIRGEFGRSSLPSLYAAADCFVSPYRADDFNLAVLEAIAVGTPAIVTAGGATDDYCDDDVAWRVCGELRQDPSGVIGQVGKFIEPDLAELTEAIAEAACGRGFDRRRFAQARVRLLQDFSWEVAAERLAAMAFSARADAGKPAHATRQVIPGLPRPLGQSFASHGHPDLLRQRTLRSKPAAQIDSHCLSVVVQGPCLRTAGSDGTPAIDDALASIRQWFPHAQIVLSTWQGSDTDGLQADAIVLSADPGALHRPGHRPNNVNRMLTSVNNGLAVASRPFCIKTRNDVLFTSATLCRKPLWPAAAALSLERRIWISSWGTSRLETSLSPFHPSDLVHYGTTDDLRRLWDVPAVTWDEAFDAQPAGTIRMVPEQSLAIGYLRSLGHDLDLQNTYDGRPETLANSLEFMLGAFDVFDGREDGVLLPRRFIYETKLRETPETFAELRHEYLRDRDATCQRVIRDYWQLVHHTLNSAA